MELSSMNELIEVCTKEKKNIGEVMLKMEEENSAKDKDTIVQLMEKRLKQMEETIRRGQTSTDLASSGISGGDTRKMNNYLKHQQPLSGDYISDAMTFALATSESNAQMGVIVATPTAGAAGVLPGVLFSLQRHAGTSYKDLVMGLFTASALGYVIANRAFVSGAAGGCQAEIGSATAIAAGTIVELKGGTPEQAVHAAAIAMKSLLGLVCDPVAGLVEVPCIKRNVIGTSIAFSSADLALAGIESRIPCDEVIQAMYNIGKDMPSALRETALGGLAATDTGKQVKERLFGQKSSCRVNNKPRDM
ncbi:L-serine ammonia-lyase [Alteribacillus persepolensis]|uniref:L-serine dehydratase n=1 Tax=Alteribacillus persepolensis TaxID=568899 RepID=A0A1G8GWF1_9BACI|nr:L-serine ammonia-lyase, iron-sulfur-dependent, subunit alpha [Alteribacillus persepolensis]SDH98722.1 L-serine ammonia-lyase [Alteribacillus persepolensis]